jgi:hypothetical protein
MSTLFIVVLVLACIHLVFDRKARTAKKILEIILTYFLVINVGLGGILAFLGHTFQSDIIAKSIGWPTGNPFQYEVAAANLAFGILGVLCIWLRGGFWLATGIGSTVFLLGAAMVHLRELVLYHNMAVNNAGLILWLDDLTLPILLLCLLIVYNYLKEKKK